MQLDKKIRTGICISDSLLQECDAYIKSGNAENRSALIENALWIVNAKLYKNYLAKERVLNSTGVK